MVAELEELKPYQAPSVDPDDVWRGWHGYLSFENVGHVAERIRLMLDGKRFTVVSVGSFNPLKPEVRVGARLDVRDRTSGLPVDSYCKQHEWGMFAGVGFSAGSYSYGFHTRLATQPPWFWLLEPDAGLAAKERARLDEPYTRDPAGYVHGAARDVLDYIDAAHDAHWSTQVVFEDHGRTLRLCERAPVGQMWSHTFTVERELTHTRALIDTVSSGLEGRVELSAKVRLLIENAEWELEL